MSHDYVSGFFAVIGRPNVGKSTLVNALVGEKVAIVSDLPQTTRNRIMGVVCRENAQIVLLDTPGIHKPRNKLGEAMMRSIDEALDGVDGLMFVADATEICGESNAAKRSATLALLHVYENHQLPKVLVVNKIDRIRPQPLIQLLDELKDEPVDDIIPISALTGENLNRLGDLLFSKLLPGPQFFPDDMMTDQSERFHIAELIREKALHRLREEVPHGIGIEVLSIAQANGKTEIHANVLVEKSSHKGIVIGKHGSMLGEIGTEARADIERMLGQKVDLRLWIKVREDWRNDERALDDLGYGKH